MKSMNPVSWAVALLLLTSCGGAPAAAPPVATPATTGTSVSTPSPSAPSAAEGVPVWWDSDGLHHGDVVEPTRVRVPTTYPALLPRLALVRTGAVYRGPTSDAIWFHPWGGRPHVVGHGTAAGPAGDPGGDTAAWFDGRTLVVYDTARGEVVSRSRELATVAERPEYAEHVGHGSGWVHVSATQVVWRAGGDEQVVLARRDLVASRTELPWQPRPANASGTPAFADVSEVSAVWAEGDMYEGRGTYLWDRAGSSHTKRVRGLEWPGRLSPDGSLLLTAEIADGTHGIAITDLRTRSAWKPFDRDVYANFSWAYGDAVVMRVLSRSGTAQTERLVTCSVSQMSCARPPTRGLIVLPNP